MRLLGVCSCRIAGVCPRVPVSCAKPLQISAAGAGAVAGTNAYAGLGKRPAPVANAIQGCKIEVGVGAEACTMAGEVPLARLGAMLPAETSTGGQGRGGGGDWVKHMWMGMPVGQHNWQIHTQQPTYSRGDDTNLVIACGQRLWSQAEPAPPMAPLKPIDRASTGQGLCRGSCHGPGEGKAKHC